MKKRRAILGMLTVTVVTMSSQPSLSFAQEIPENDVVVAVSTEEIKGQALKKDIVQTINGYIAELQNKANSDHVIAKMKGLISTVESIYDHVAGNSPSYVEYYRKQAKQAYDEFMKTAQDKVIMTVTLKAGDGVFSDGTKEKTVSVENGRTLREAGIVIQEPAIANDFFEFDKWALEGDGAGLSTEHLYTFPIQRNESLIATYKLKSSVAVIEVEGDEGVVEGSQMYVHKGTTWGEVRPQAEALIELRPEYYIVSWEEKETGKVLTDETVLDRDTMIMVHTVQRIAGEKLNHVPEIKAEDRTLTVGDKFDVLEGVTAMDAEDGEIRLTEDNVESNDVNVKKAGTYHVTYKVSDSQGATVKKTIQVVVNPKMESLNHVPEIKAEDRTLTVGDKFDVLEGVTAMDAEDGEIRLTEDNVESNDVNVKKAGTYHVTYKVSDSQGATVKKTIQVVVNPKMESLNHVPEIKAEDRTLTVGDKFDVLEGVTAMDAEDGEIRLTEDNVESNDVNVKKAGTYHVTYKVSDSQGATVKKTIQVVVNPKMESLNHVPEIKAEDRTLTVGDKFDVLEGVTAMDAEDGEIRLTEDNVESNDVNVKKAGTYHVTYKVSDSQGATVKKTIQVVVKEKMESSQEKQEEQKKNDQKKNDQKKNITRKDNKAKQANAPKTGDISSFGWMAGLLAGSSGILSAILRKHPKKK
ncbi:MAG: DUF5011 domain-containing protein [[Ruminococcus] gnavus]|nr:DUF5011 domain-containing protein [Mediterraneibacter gnavus]